MSDSATTDLESGGAAIALPIAVPAGPGGLAPVLNLTYDSSRVSAMRTQTALGSWTGIGWDLSAGSISGDMSNATADGVGFALSLAMNGVSGRIEEQSGSSPSTWYMSDHSFDRIQFGCAVSCGWIVTDKHGTRYEFGVAAMFSPNPPRRAATTGTSTTATARSSAARSRTAPGRCTSAAPTNCTRTAAW